MCVCRSASLSLSLCAYVCLSVCLSLSLSLCAYVCLSVCLSLSLSAYVCLSVCPSLSLSLSLCAYVCLSVCPPLSLSLCAYVCLSVCLFNFSLSVCLSVPMCVCRSAPSPLSLCPFLSLCFSGLLSVFVPFVSFLISGMPVWKDYNVIRSVTEIYGNRTAKLHIRKYKQTKILEFFSGLFLCLCMSVSVHLYCLSALLCICQRWHSRKKPESGGPGSKGLKAFPKLKV